LSTLAARPSKKSKKMPAKAKKDAETKSPETANIIATQPQSRFKEVMMFGICLIIYKRY